MPSYVIIRKVIEMDYELDMNKIPTHIAMILDGNGRWAKKRGLPRTAGHRKGAFNIETIAFECERLGVKYMTCYCFSTENWKRPEDEVNYLMKLPIRYFKKAYKTIINSNIKIKMIGRRDRFTKEFLKTVEEIEETTKDHTGLVLTLCLDYGSYDEITTAVKEIATEVKDGKLEISDITPQTISNHLFTKNYPPLDLLIRTSGEYRISNYLLWQIAYSEFYFTDVLWPDFDASELHKALYDYQNRNRRFGGLKK